MDFFAKKLISAMLLPVPITLVLLAIGLCLYWIIGKSAWTNTFLTLSFILLALFSFNPLPTALLTHLEQQYPVLTQLPNTVQTIVVLGGGVRDNTKTPPNTQLSSAALSRLIEALRLYRQNPNATIILSGGRVFGSLSESKTMNNLAVSLGVPPKHLIIENGSRDTHEEARYLKKMLGKRPFALVTSAFHMPRAMAIFKKQGMQPIPAPTQFIAKQNPNAISFYLPNAVNLIHTDIALHEYLGIGWGKLTGHL